MMNKRRITHVKRNNNGEIIALCKPGESWSPRYMQDVISDIESGDYMYYELDVIGFKVYVEVKEDPVKGKFLKSEEGDEIYCDIRKLPDCPDY